MKMRAISLMYHDIVGAGAWRTSGFASDDADIYKLDAKSFEEHLQSINEACQIKPTLVTKTANDAGNLFITFDDGGRGAYLHAAELLERRGWRGHFFAATDYIDTPTFLSCSEIRELDGRGHIIGSHSASHPLRMAACSPEKLREEWRKSAETLAEILGKPTIIASVPGGHFSKEVALAASDAGIEILFNSEPVTVAQKIGNCRVFGRYSIMQKTSATEAAQIARGEIAPRLKQYFYWNAKKIAKKVGGEFYLDVRKRILAKR